ncbi:MAG: insulinase family protein, partial [Chitinophagaceae bacterium]|nr:insulinase family protein [Chitinophagaceae bacterium]
SQDAQVVVVGDMTQAEVLPKLAFLDRLPKKKVTLPKITAAPGIDKTKIYLVNVPKAAQSEFRVGYATGLKYDATGDYYKSYLMNWPLGGAFNSRINLNLREDKGWTYGARSGFSGDEYSGGYEFSSGIRANATDSALAEVMREMRDYVQSGPKDDELVFLKSAIGQSDALRYETGPQKAQFIRRILDYDLPANYIDVQSNILKGMTKAQMQAFAKKYLNPDKMNILVVGDKKQILPGLQKMGYEIVELDTDGNVMK